MSDSDSDDDSYDAENDEVPQVHFKSGWALRYHKYNEGDGAISIYLLGGKSSIYDFQPLLKSIVADAFDSKVRSWLNTMEYIEDESEQERVKSLISDEIRNFGRWMFKGACDQRSKAGLQSRYMLVESGRSENNTDLTLHVESAIDASTKRTQDLFLTKCRDLLIDDAFKTNYWMHPDYILLCLMGDANETAFWQSLRLPIGSRARKSFKGFQNVLKKGERGTEDATSLFDALKNLKLTTSGLMLQLNTDVIMGDQERAENALLHRIRALLLSSGARQEFAECEAFLKARLRHLWSLEARRTVRTGAAQIERVRASWKDLFLQTLNAGIKSLVGPSNAFVIFGSEEQLKSEDLPKGFNSFCTLLLRNFSSPDANALAYPASLVAGSIMSRTAFEDYHKTEKKHRKLGQLGCGDDDSDEDGGLGDVYRTYRNHQTEPRMYRLGHDLLSMHDIKPLSNNFYEAARLEAYFRAKSAESRMFKKRRTEDAFSGYDDEFARVAHRKEVFRHPKLQRDNEKDIIIKKAIELLVNPPQCEEWYINDDCYQKQRTQNTFSESVAYLMDVAPLRKKPGEDDIEPVRIPLHCVHASEYLFQQEHPHNVLSLTQGIKGGVCESKPLEWFFDSKGSPGSTAGARPLGGLPPSSDEEYVLLPVSTGGNVLDELYIDPNLWWMAGDTFSLFTDALTLCIKFVNKFCSLDNEAYAEVSHDHDDDAPTTDNSTAPAHAQHLLHRAADIFQEQYDSWFDGTINEEERESRLSEIRRLLREYFVLHDEYMKRTRMALLEKGRPIGMTLRSGWEDGGSQDMVDLITPTIAKGSSLKQLQFAVLDPGEGFADADRQLVSFFTPGRDLLQSANLSIETAESGITGFTVQDGPKLFPTDKYKVQNLSKDSLELSHDIIPVGTTFTLVDRTTSAAPNDFIIHTVTGVKPKGTSKTQIVFTPELTTGENNLTRCNVNVIMNSAQDFFMFPDDKKLTWDPAKLGATATGNGLTILTGRIPSGDFLILFSNSAPRWFYHTYDDSAKFIDSVRGTKNAKPTHMVPKKNVARVRMKMCSENYFGPSAPPSPSALLDHFSVLVHTDPSSAHYIAPKRYGEPEDHLFPPLPLRLGIKPSEEGSELNLDVAVLFQKQTWATASNHTKQSINAKLGVLRTMQAQVNSQKNSYSPAAATAFTDAQKELDDLTQTIETTSVLFHTPDPRVFPLASAPFGAHRLKVGEEGTVPCVQYYFRPEIKYEKDEHGKHFKWYQGKDDELLFNA